MKLNQSNPLCVLCSATVQVQLKHLSQSSSRLQGIEMFVCCGPYIGRHPMLSATTIMLRGFLVGFSPRWRSFPSPRAWRWVCCLLRGVYEAGIDLPVVGPAFRFLHSDVPNLVGLEPRRSFVTEGV